MLLVCSESCRGPSRAYPVIIVAVLIHSPTRKWFYTNYLSEEKDFAQPRSWPSISLASVALSAFLLPFPPFPKQLDKLHIKMHTSQPQGHLQLWPGAALALGSSLSCSLTLSKKDQITAFPSTFLQTILFDFLSLDQLSFP